MRLDKKGLFKWPGMPAFAMCIVFVLLNIFFAKGFVQKHIVLNFLSTNIPLLCVVVGCSATILGGGMDISQGAIICLVNVIFVELNEAGVPLALQILISLLAAVAMGAINGVVIGILRVTPLLATYATSCAYAGIALWIMGKPTGTVMRAFCKWYNSYLFNVIPVPVLFLLFLLLVWYVLMRTPWKYWLFSSGKNGARAYTSAVPVGRTQMFSYIFAGFSAGIGGLAISGATQGGDASVGLSISMNALAACVIGGISLAGGSGSPLGAVFGGLFLSLVIFLVSSLGIPSLYQSLLRGLILLIGVMCSVVIEVRIQKKSRSGRVRGSVSAAEKT